MLALDEKTFPTGLEWELDCTCEGSQLERYCDLNTNRWLNINRRARYESGCCSFGASAAILLGQIESLPPVRTP